MLSEDGQRCLRCGSFSSEPRGHAGPSHDRGCQSKVRETHIIQYTADMLPEPLKELYMDEVGKVRNKFFAEDAVLNLAVAQWATAAESMDSA